MPDMKTALTSALSGAGLKPKTQIERIWLWLRDHPNQTSQRVRLELKLSKNNVSSLLSQMVKRKMVQSRQETDRLGSRNVFRVTDGMKEFELLPRPAVSKKDDIVDISTIQTPTKVKTYAQVQMPVQPQKEIFPLSQEEKPLPVQVLCEEPQLPKSPTVLVDALTVAQAREMYNILHKLFGKC